MMSKFTFICEDEALPFGDSISSKKTVEFSAVSIDDILKEFEMFLNGCGFNLNGKCLSLEDIDEVDEKVWFEKVKEMSKELDKHSIHYYDTDRNK
jgi:hypothetical protein